MILPLPQISRRYFLIDVDTQRDFLLAGGGLCTRNHREVLAHIRRLMAWARHRNIPIISIAEAYRERDCTTISHPISDTKGQTKIRYTLLRNRTSFPADGMNYLPADLLLANKQVVLYKRCIDPFDEPRIDRLLSESQAQEFIVFGACTEGAVKATALGLLQRGKKVRVVVDAIGSQNRKEAELALHKMQVKGARLTMTKDLAGISHLRKVGTCYR